MKESTITGIVILAIFLPLLLVDELFFLFQILMIILTLIASSEMLRMYDKQKHMPIKMKVITIICSLLLYLAVLVELDPNSIVNQQLKLFNISLELLPTIILILLVLFTSTVFCHAYDATDIGKSLLTIIYTGVGFSAITILKYFGTRYIVYLFLITICTDVFAYFTGMLFGKHKMAPTISPKKTWEGAIGGSLVATIVAVCFGLFYGDLFGDFFGNTSSTLLDKIINVDKVGDVGVVFILIFLTLFATIFSQIGDLVASRMKRTYGIKDFGNCFPGHGGVLDRLDSAIMTSIFLLCIFQILSYFLPVMP